VFAPGVEPAGERRRQIVGGFEGVVAAGGEAGKGLVVLARPVGGKAVVEQDVDGDAGVVAMAGEAGARPARCVGDGLRPILKVLSGLLSFLAIPAPSLLAAPFLAAGGSVSGSTEAARLRVLLTVDGEGVAGGVLRRCPVGSRRIIMDINNAVSEQIQFSGFQRQK
jgi:hypothetical protein